MIHLAEILPYVSQLGIPFMIWTIKNFKKQIRATIKEELRAYHNDPDYFNKPI